jgi:hypothetical protein
MDSSDSPKDEIWFLRGCHHISNAVYLDYATAALSQVLSNSSFHHAVYRLMYSSAGVFHATIATFLLIQRFLSVFPSNCTLCPVEGSSAKRSTLADKFQGFVPAADSTLHVFLVIAGYYNDYFCLKRKVVPWLRRSVAITSPWSLVQYQARLRGTVGVQSS